MSMGNGEFVIDGQPFSADRITAAPSLGTTEDWTITNNSMMDHPFHIHVWPFQVISRSDGTSPDPGWRDTVNIPTGTSVTVRIPFEDFGGKTVFHCHILDHEDLGMMANVNVT
jgi:FtsP/CotA-like multicopper oxidase with cupredoxin domain